MNSLVGKFISAWVHPWAAVQGVKDEGEQTSIVPSMIFIVVMGLLSGIITAVMGMVFPPANAVGAGKAFVWLAVLVVPVVSFLGSFLGAFIIFGLVDGILKGTSEQYKTAYRLLAVLAAFSPISALLAPIPKVGQFLAIAVNVWATIVMIRGIIVVRDTPPVRTWVACGILFAFLFLLGIFDRVAAQRNLPGAPLGDLEAGLGGDLGGLDAELQNLANDAKAPAAPADTQKK
jgi:hypothetical protein